MTSGTGSSRVLPASQSPSSILPHHKEAVRGGQKRRSLFGSFLLSPGTWSGTAKVLCPHQVCPEADRYACWAPRASERLSYVGIWAPFQGPLCHFLATFMHTEVVRWGRLLKAQPCWEPSTASEEWYQPTQCPSVAGQHTHFTDVETETPEKGAASPSDEQHPTSRLFSPNPRWQAASHISSNDCIYYLFIFPLRTLPAHPTPHQQDGCLGPLEAKGYKGELGAVCRSLGEMELPSKKLGFCPPLPGGQRGSNSEAEEKVRSRRAAFPAWARGLCFSKGRWQEVSATKGTGGVQPPGPGCNDLIKHFQLL